MGMISEAKQLNRKNEKTRIGVGRTEVSIPFLGRIFRALSHRDGPVGPSLPGMPEKFDYHVFVSTFCLTFLLTYFFKHENS